MDNYRKPIIEYLRRNLKKGYSLEPLRWALIGQGYPRASIDRAIEELNRELPKKALAVKEEPKIKYEFIDENNMPIKQKKSFWKRFFGIKQ